MDKKKTILILIIFIVILIAFTLFYTYAIDIKMDRTVGDADLTFNINITDTNGRIVTVPKGESKVFDVFLTNNNGGTIRYGLAYSGTKPDTVTIAQMSNSKNTVNSTIPDNTTYQVTITIINDSDTEQSFTIAPVTGYQNGGDLIIPSGYTLITDTQLALPQPANDYIISLSKGNSLNSGARGVYQTNGHEYRYVGANVNNWVRFNDDDYRIIGVFDDNSHGVTGQNLVKLISAEKLIGTSWGIINNVSDYKTYSGFKNNWDGLDNNGITINGTGIEASANVLLNEYFLNATDVSLTYNLCSEWTYYNDSNNYKTKDCSNIVGYGIQTQSLRNYIQPVTWYLKGFDSTSYSKSEFYNCERGKTTGDSEKDVKCTSGNNGGYSSTVTDNSIGLMYVSDYMYASGNYSTTNTAISSEYYYGQQNWLFQGYEWTITPTANTNNNVFYIHDGELLSADTRFPEAIRPTFYLKSTIKIKSGNGSFDNPYIIGL